MAEVTAVILTRSDPARNMHRYYRLDVQHDLFGAWCLQREWGRIGQAGQGTAVSRRQLVEPLASIAAQRLVTGDALGK